MCPFNRQINQIRVLVKSNPMKWMHGILCNSAEFVTGGECYNLLLLVLCGVRRQMTRGAKDLAVRMAGGQFQQNQDLKFDKDSKVILMKEKRLGGLRCEMKIPHSPPNKNMIWFL